jgi:hypothetical protein
MQADSSRTEKFWRRVLIGTSDGCWNWCGRKSPKGYGRWEHDGRIIGAHRFAYMLTKGVIPDGLMLRHSCDNPGCVNPAHLEPGTARQNAADAIERGRFCKGERNGRAKLTPQEVISIRANPAGLNVTRLAQAFGVSKATISLIRSNKRW